MTSRATPTALRTHTRARTKTTFYFYVIYNLLFIILSFIYIFCFSLFIYCFYCFYLLFYFDVLFSSDEPASAGEVNVEVPSWHSVGVVTRHPPKVTHHSHIYAFIYQYIIHLNVHIIHTYRPLYINI